MDLLQIHAHFMGKKPSSVYGRWMVSVTKTM